MATCFTLNDGHKMPAVGLGTFQGTYDYKNSFDTVVAAVHSALQAGYRHFDTAILYDTEEPVGHALKEAFTKGQVKRKDLFITTKLWSTDHRREDVVPGLKKSLAMLDMEYVDMFLIHWPMALKAGDENFPKDKEGNFLWEDDITDYLQTWEGMEECKRLGLAKSIGISNFNKKQLIRLAENCKVMPANLQVEGHPFFQNTEISDLCAKYGILMSCFSPVGKPSRPWAKDGDPSVFTDPVLKTLSEKYKKKPAQIALKFHVQLGHAVVPKSNSPERQLENISIFDFELSEDDMKLIKQECEKNFRVLWLEHLSSSKEYPFK